MKYIGRSWILTLFNRILFSTFHITCFFSPYSGYMYKCISISWCTFDNEQRRVEPIHFETWII